MRCSETIGDCTLYLGDARDWLASVPPSLRVAAVVTDPPYGVSLVRKTSDFRDSKHFDGGKSLQASTVYADDPAEIAALVGSVIPAALGHAERGLIFSGTAMLPNYPTPATIGCVYLPNGAGRSAWGFQCMQPILYYGKDPYLQDGLGGRPNSFRTEQPNREQIDHPCPKPLPWMLWAISRASRPEETILDPFMGSGTTGVACVNLGRKFIGIEIDERYFQIACRRIEEAYRQPRLFAEPPPKPVQGMLL